MENPNNFQRIGLKRAFFHIFLLPAILFSITFIIDESYSLVASVSYVLFMTLLQYIRLVRTDRVHLRIYSRAFFDVLKIVTTFIVVAIFALIIGVAL